MCSAWTNRLLPASRWHSKKGKALLRPKQLITVRRMCPCAGHDWNPTYASNRTPREGTVYMVWGNMAPMRSGTGLPSPPHQPKVDGRKEGGREQGITKIRQTWPHIKCCFLFSLWWTTVLYLNMSCPSCYDCFYDYRVNNMWLLCLFTMHALMVLLFLAYR